MKLTQLVRWSAALCLALAICRADVIPVTTGVDPLTPAPLVPGSLRYAVSIAQPGDTIRLQRSLIVNLENDITVLEGLDGVTIEADESAQIRARIERGNNSQGEAIRVRADHITLRNLTFRDVSVSFGITQGVLEIEGGTVANCVFTQSGSLDFIRVTGGLIDNNRFELTNDLSGGTGSVTTFFTKDCAVQNNVIQRGAKAGGFGSTECENLTLKSNTTNADFFLQSKSVTVQLNKLTKASIHLDTFSASEPGVAMVEENECGALHARGLNLTVRKNKVSGRLLKKSNGFVAGGFADEEEEAVTALYIEATRAGNDTTTTGPVLVELNETAGGVFGLLVSVRSGATQVTLQDNQLARAVCKGIVINQANPATPLSVLRNTLNECGIKRVRGELPAGIHLRTITSPDVLVEGNMVTKTGGGGSGILVGTGSPRLKDNTITGGSSKGLTIIEGATPVIEGNIIEKAAKGGVYLLGSVVADLADITLRQNGRAGIVVNSGGTLQTTNATIEDNKGPGIIFRTGTKGTITGGRIHGNKGAGVSVEKQATAQLDRVSFQGNGGAGIDLAPKGVTPNTKTKQANGDIDFPDQLTFDGEARLIRGIAEPGAIVQLFKVEDGKLLGNKKNGEGVTYVGEATVTGNGDFAIAPGPAQEGDLFTLTATRPGAQPVTSEFSLNVEVEPAPPVEAISVSSNEEFGNDRSEMAGSSLNANRTISENSRFVAFTSLASNLVNDDTNGFVDVFVRDRVNGTTERVNLSSSGAQAELIGSYKPQSSWPSISADGRYVAFACEDIRLVPQDGSNEYNVFLRDRQTNTTTAVTLFTEMGTGEMILGGGADCSISADGSTVVFTSIQDYVPSNFGYDLFAWRRQSGQFLWVNVPGPGGVQGTAAPFFSAPRLSSTGRFVVFNTSHAFVGTDTNAGTDIYLRDLEGGTTEIVSIDNDGNELFGGSPSISADGRFVAFVTPTSRDAGDTNNKPDIYLRDRQTGTLHWVSPPPEGGFPTPNLNQGCNNPSISADGRYVAFSASGNTTRPNSLTELIDDVFVHDRQTGKTVEVSLGADGDARGGSGLPCLGYDGRTIVFVTFGNLLSTDTNQADDIYAREISGDFPP